MSWAIIRRDATCLLLRNKKERFLVALERSTGVATSCWRGGGVSECKQSNANAQLSYGRNVHCVHGFIALTLLPVITPNIGLILTGCKQDTETPLA